MITDSVDGDAWLGEGKRVLLEAAEALTALAQRLDAPTWALSVSLVLNTTGRVVVTGMGKSGAVGHKLASTLSSLGTHALFLHPAEAVHGDLGMLAAGDTVIAISYSGETDELLAILPGISRLEIPIIAFTSNRHSTLAKASRTVVDVGVPKEACLFGAPTTSTTAMIAMGDALAITVMRARGFSEEDYAKLHPGGSLGRKLTLRIADVMRQGDAVAIVSTKASLIETVFAITKAHAGAAIIVDDAGVLAGLITDGDIRRHLLDDGDIRTRIAGDILNPNPGTVPPHLLAVEGLQMLDEFHPDPGSKAGEAPVIDNDGRPIGMLMLKDLVKAGITTY